MKLGVDRPGERTFIAVALAVLMLLSIPAMATSGPSPGTQDEGAADAGTGPTASASAETAAGTAESGAINESREALEPQQATVGTPSTLVTDRQSSAADARTRTAETDLAQGAGDDRHTVLVFDNDTGDPIERAAVRNDSDRIASTDLWGHATLTDPPTSVTVRKDGYDPRTVELTGNHTDIGLEPAVPGAQFYDLTVLLYDQKTQTAVEDGFSIVMNRLEWRGETYAVPGESEAYQPLIDDLEAYATQHPESEWAKTAVDLLKGQTVRETTMPPSLTDSGELKDTTPSAEFLLPTGEYRLRSTTAQYEDTSETLELSTSAIAEFYLEPRTGNIELSFDPDVRNHDGDPWEVEDFSIEIFKSEGDTVVKRDTFAPNATLTDHGELRVDGNDVTIADYPAGTYNLTVRSPGFDVEPRNFSDVAVPAGGTADLDADLVANQTRLEVEVISSIYEDEGEPMALEGAPVRIEGKTGAADGYTAENDTQSDGTVTFDGIPNGQYEVVVNETETQTDDVTAVFKPQSLTMNLGSTRGPITDPPDPSTPELGEWNVDSGSHHKLTVNLMPTTGHARGEVVGNGSAELLPVVMWLDEPLSSPIPGVDPIVPPFDGNFRSLTLDDVEAEFEGEFDGHDLNLADTDLIDEEDLEWETTSQGGLYGDLPPGVYDIDLTRETDGNSITGGFRDRELRDIALNSSGTTILSPDEDPENRSSADPIGLERAGDYVFGQLRVSTGNHGVYNATDLWAADVGVRAGSQWGPIGNAELRFQKGSFTKTVTTNASGHFHPGYLEGGDWEVTIVNHEELPYEFEDQTFDVELAGKGELRGLVLSAQAESDPIEFDITDQDDDPLSVRHSTVTNNINSVSCVILDVGTGCVGPASVPQSPRAYTVDVDDKCFDCNEEAYPMFEKDLRAGETFQQKDDTRIHQTEQREAALSGYLYNETTWKPIAGAEVEFGDGGPVETDEKGYYEFDERVTIGGENNVAPDVAVTVRHETVTEQSFTKVDLTPGRNRFDLYVEPDAGTVKGNVTDTEGQPVEGVRVIYEGNKTAGAGGTTTYTESDGTFELNLEAGTEDNATFRFEHPDLYPANGEFDLDIEPDDTYWLPDDDRPTRIKINRTASVDIAGISYQWADESAIPDDTHVLSGLATRDNLTKVEMTVRVNRVPDDVPDPTVSPEANLELDLGDRDVRTWLREEDDIEKGTVLFDHTERDWLTEERFEKEEAGGDHRYDLTTNLTLAHVPVTHLRNEERPVAVNVTVTTERNGTEQRDRTLADSGTGDTNLYVNKPPRPLDAVLGDRLSKQLDVQLFTTGADSVDFDGTELDGKYPEVSTDVGFEGEIDRNGGLEYTYTLDLGLSFSVGDDFPDSMALLDTALMPLPNEFAVEESVSVDNGEVVSKLGTEVGATQDITLKWVKSLEWLNGVEPSPSTEIKVGYRSEDEYALPPTEEEFTPTWSVDGKAAIGITADLIELWPQLKPVAAAGGKLELGTSGGLTAAISGERARDGDAYFGPVDTGEIELEPSASVSVTLGLEPGIGPFSVSVAEGKVTGKTTLVPRFGEGRITPTGLRLNGSITASANALGYEDDWDIAGPGTILGPYDLASGSQVQVRYIERERGFDLAYRLLEDYHNVTGAREGTLVEGTYPRAIPQHLAGEIAYVHDENVSSPPGSLESRTLAVGDNDTDPAPVGGPPIGLAGDGGGALVASHLPQQAAYPKYPLRYLRDAGLSLIERTPTGWSEPIRISAAGNQRMDLYPVLASTDATHYVAWRSDSGVNPATTDDADLRFAAVDRASGAVTDSLTLEPTDVVVPADIAASSDTVAVLAATSEPAGTATLTLHYRVGGTWDSTVVASGRDVDPDAAVAAIDPETGTPLVAWHGNGALRVETPAAERTVVGTDGDVGNVDLETAGDRTVLVWTEASADGHTLYQETLPTNRPAPDVIGTTGANQRIDGLSIDVSGPRTNVTYAVQEQRNGAVDRSAGTDIVFRTLDSRPAGLTVGIRATNAPITAGQALTVTAEVENTNRTETVQEIRLDIDGQVVNSTSVTIAGGETETVTLEWETESADAGEYTATVAGEDGSDSTTVRVEPSVPAPPPPVPPPPSPLDDLATVEAYVLSVQADRARS